MQKDNDVVHEETVHLRAAKAKLSSLTKQAKAGTRIVITSHGAPIADLVSHGTSTTPTIYLKRPGPLPKLIKLKGSGLTASEIVLRDREE